jgi:hypothetical protein
MRRYFWIPLSLSLVACAAPEIADWPQKAPDVPEVTIQRYVDIYGREPARPMYGLDDIDALILLSRDGYNSNASDPEIDRLKQKLEDLQTQMKSDSPAEPSGRSRTEINALKKRIAETEDSPSRRRMILKRKYGVPE